MLTNIQILSHSYITGHDELFPLAEATIPHQHLLQTVCKLEIRSMERGICPIAVFYFALKRSFFNI